MTDDEFAVAARIAEEYGASCVLVSAREDVPSVLKFILPDGYAGAIVLPIEALEDRCHFLGQALLDQARRGAA